MSGKNGPSGLPRWAAWYAVVVALAWPFSRLYRAAMNGGPFSWPPQDSVEASLASAVLVFGTIALAYGTLAIPAVSSWLERRAERRMACRISALAAKEHARYRALHEEETRLWEAFYVAALRAIRYPIEAWYLRIPAGPAWEAFLVELPPAVVAAHDLPKPHRAEAIRFTGRIEKAIQASARLVLDPAENELTQAIFGLQRWTSEMRMHHFLPLYTRCGMREPPLTVLWPEAKDFRDLSPSESIPPRLR